MSLTDGTGDEAFTPPGGVREEDTPLVTAAQSADAHAHAAAEPQTAVETILERATKDLRFKMIVSELSNFDMDGREDAAAEREYCMTISPVTLDYLEQVAARFGGGVYLFELYERGKGFVKGGRWTERIKRVAKTASEPAPASAPMAPPAATPQPDPMRELADSLLKKQLEKMFDDPKPSQAQAQSAPDPLRELADGLLKKRLEKVFDDPEPTAPVAAPGSSTIADIAALAQALGVRELIVPAGTVIGNALALSFAQRTQQTQQQNGPTAPAGAAPPPPISIVPPAAPPAEEEKTDMEIVLEDAMSDMLLSAPVDKAAEDIREVIAAGEHPALAELMELPALEILRTLSEGHERKEALVSNVGYVRWWDELKAAVQKGTVDAA